MEENGRTQKPQYAFVSTTGDDGPKKPSALPPGTSPAPGATKPAGDRLTLSVSGTGQVVTLKVSRSRPTTGDVTVKGLGGLREIRVRSGQKISLTVSGTGNLVQIPEAVRSALQVKTSGVGNRITYY